MNVSKSPIFTVALAFVAAVVLWPGDEDAPETSDQGSSVGSAEVSNAHRSSSTVKVGGGHDAPPSSVSVMPEPPPNGAEEPRAAPSSPLTAQMIHMRAEAFRGWHDTAEYRLMRCLPAWTEVGEPRPIRVHFRPSSEVVDDEVVRRLRADTIDPLEPDVDVPAKVLECLDGLLGTQIELPEASAELERGHQEIIHVMWS